MAPASARTTTKSGRNWLREGLIAGTGQVRSGGLDDTAEALFQNFKKSNPYALKVGTTQTMQNVGYDAVVAEFSNHDPDAPLPSGNEAGLIVVISGDSGQVGYLVLFCSDRETWFPTFRQMIWSLAFDRAAATSVTSPSTSHVYIEPWQTLIHDTISVKAGQALQYNFGLIRGTRLSAQFQVSGGLNNTIQVLMLDQDNYQRYSFRQHYAVIRGASSEVRGVGRYNFTVPQTGVYYVLLDNGQAWLMPRNVVLRLDAVLPETTPESEKMRHDFENLYSVLKRAFVFTDFQISVRHCGVVNAFSNPNITLCAELIDELSRQNLPGVLEFVFFHELGHTLLRTWGLPLWDNEDAADEFATVFMMMTKQQQAALQAAQWWASQGASTTDAVAKIYMDDRHSLSPQRARNVIRWLNNEKELIPRWQKQFIPNMQTAFLQELLRNPQGFDTEQIRLELNRRAVPVSRENLMEKTHARQV
jgi:hypothetical protein